MEHGNQAEDRGDLRADEAPTAVIRISTWQFSPNAARESARARIDVMVARNLAARDRADTDADSELRPIT
jgi:hypothetical protein